jgi:hypothetical protein
MERTVIANKTIEDQSRKEHYCADDLLPYDITQARGNKGMKTNADELLIRDGRSLMKTLIRI